MYIYTHSRYRWAIDIIYEGSALGRAEPVCGLRGQAAGVVAALRRERCKHITHSRYRWVIDIIDEGSALGGALLLCGLRGWPDTRYCFVSGLLSTNQYYSLRTLPLFRHPPPPCHRLHYCAVQCFPPTPRYCNIYHTILAMAISCKGQLRGQAACVVATL